ncbi:MAG: glycosyltransferase [Phenylobacterium sp.]|uniref:glycosyltransferase n=1 Tax=Phenylobacterium sp. TaxID=1871053 RepID=UPI00391A7F93
MARICLITPGHLSTNPRLVKEADALAAAGHDVHVVACRYSAWGEAADAAFAARPWSRSAPVPFGPRAPLPRRLAQKARRSLWRARLKAGHSPPPAALAAALHDASAGLAAAAEAVPADLYVAHYVAALPAAARAAARHGARYAFDAEDFHTGDLPDRPEHAFERDLIGRIEAALLPGCAYLTAASPGIAEAYARAYGVARPQVVLNVFPTAEAPPSPSPQGGADPGPSVYWFSQTIGPDRGLECAVRALPLAASRPHLHLRGLPAAGYAEALQALAREQGVADRLHLLSPAPPDRMVGLAAAFDLGLVGETGVTTNRRIALTNKQFTYLLAGVPSLLSDIPAHRDFAAEAPGAAVLYPADDPAGLAAAMDALLLDPASLARARSAAFALGRDRFNWEIEQSRLLAAVEAALP